MKKGTIHISAQELLDTVRQYLPHANIDRIQNAFDLMVQSHEGQTRQGQGEPYATHPLAAAMTVANLQADEDTVIATLLHDVPEDTNITLQRITDMFGTTVSQLVDGVTKLGEVHFIDRESAKTASLRKMFQVMDKDKRVILIKLADRLHNIMTLEGLPPEKKQRIAQETLEIFVPLAGLFGIWEIKHTLEDLCMKVLLPEEYTMISQKLVLDQKQYQKNRKIIIDTILERCKERNIHPFIYPFQKSHYSVYKKLLKMNISLDKVHETQTIRIITKSLEQCYIILGIIHNIWKPKMGRFKDYIAVPKKNNYQSLHTTIFGPQGVITEIQIRTEEMEKNSRIGTILQAAPKKGEKEEQASWIDEILDIVNAQEVISQHFVKKLELDKLQKSISVFTPQGEVIDLKKGSTPIDFAYAIHSSIGNSYESAVVNDEPVSITYQLKSGDTVQIYTSKKSHPKIDWIDSAKTHLAQKHIRKYLKKIPKLERILFGKEILSHKLELMGLNQNLSRKQMHELLNIYKKKNPENIYKAIGEGEITVQDIVDILYEKTNFPWLERIWCKIIGQKPLHKVNIKILLEDRVGMLAAISHVAKELNISIGKVKTPHRRTIDSMTIQIKIENMNQAYEFIKQLVKIKGVIKIQRVTQRTALTVEALFSLNIIYWITQPFIVYLNVIPNATHLQYIVPGMFLALINAFYFKTISKYLFPKITDLLYLWRSFIFINSFIILLLLIENWFIGLQIAPIIIASFIVILGGITIIDYYQFKYGPKE